MSLQHRMDNRDKKTFADNIKDYTKREKIWAGIYASELRLQGHKVEIKDHGIDNDGNVIDEKLKNNNPDYLFVVDNESYLLEIKNIPLKSPYYTIKTKSLESCIKHKAYILIPKLDEYYIILPETMQILLDTLHHHIYKRFSPNDKAVRIYGNKMRQLVNEELIINKKWSNTTRIEISKKESVLFKKKKVLSKKTSK